MILNLFCNLFKHERRIKRTYINRHVETQYCILCNCNLSATQHRFLSKPLIFVHQQTDTDISIFLLASLLSRSLALPLSLSVYRSLSSFYITSIEKYFWFLWGWFQQKPDFSRMKQCVLGAIKSYCVVVIHCTYQNLPRVLFCTLF